MALETSTILRSVLFQLYTAETLEKAIVAVEAMCQGDDIAAVEKKVLKYRELKPAEGLKG